MKTTCSILLAVLSLVCVSAHANAEEIWVYLGTYTRGSDSQGIYVAKLNLETGQLSPAQLAGRADNPSFLAVAPDGRHLIAVEEIDQFDGERSGALRSFTIDPGNGQLTPVNQVSTHGAAPCHLVTDSAGRHVLFANYSGGNAGAYRMNDDGRLTQRTGFAQHEGSSVNARRQSGPHAHSINLDPAGRFAFVADLGLDKIMIYQFDADTGALTPNDPAFAKVKPGAGPRHFDFRPDGKFAYVINEMDSTITAFAYDEARGSLSEIQTVSTLPDGHEGGNSTAHIEVHPSGRFLYGSNRGHDSIAVFAIDGGSGRLTSVEIEPSGGKVPRNFGIDPTGRYLLAAGQNSGNVASFRIDVDTGALTPTGSSIEVPRAVCVRFLRPHGSGFTSLFDGRSVRGWEGEEKWFRVEDGAIVAGSLEERIPVNQFLVSEKEYGDFELKLKARLIGEGDNAGIQFWSQRIPNHHEMIGFQCDIGRSGDRSIWGALYDESRRRRMLDNVPMPTQRVTRFDDWNEFRILARGNSITIWINGALATHYYETEPVDKVPRRGRFGLQIHSGPPAEAWYKDIEIREF